MALPCKTRSRFSLYLSYAVFPASQKDAIAIANLPTDRQAQKKRIFGL